MAKAKVIAVANQKDGVGKSTTIVNLGADLARTAKRYSLASISQADYQSRIHQLEREKAILEQQIEALRGKSEASE